MLSSYLALSSLAPFSPLTPSLAPFSSSDPPWASGLPAPPGTIIRPSSSALVSRHSAFTMDFQAFVCSVALQIFGSVGLLLTSGSTSVFCCTSSASALILLHPGFTLANCPRNLQDRWLCLCLHLHQLHLCLSSP